MKCIDSSSKVCPNTHYYYNDTEAEKDELTRCILISECNKYHTIDSKNICITNETNNVIITTCNSSYPYMIS